MSPQRMLLLILASCLLVGCATQKMMIGNIDAASIKPMGVFVCTSTGIMVDDKDVVHQQFVVDVASRTLAELLKEKYDVKLLNDKIPYNEAFKRHFGSFVIDEQLIARVAKEEHCNSVLFVHYSVYSFDSVVILGVIPTAVVALGNDPKSDLDNMRLHSHFDLHGWLVSTNSGKILAKSLTIANPFSVYSQDKNDKEELGKSYRQYFRDITQDMLGYNQEVWKK